MLRKAAVLALLAALVAVAALVAAPAADAQKTSHRRVSAHRRHLQRQLLRELRRHPRLVLRKRIRSPIHPAPSLVL
jgi:type II secretory pathway component PulK